MTRLLLAVLLSSSCAQVTLSSPLRVDHYQGVTVTIYSNGRRCKTVVVTPTTTIDSGWTWCRWIPQP